ncbi:MAG TPA: hypothetical protein VGF33_03070 [Caulobacteraceae bacterium]|jgi:hypothetical protein
MKTPPLVERPALAKWLFDRNMTVQDGAEYFGTNVETLRRTLKPVSHPLLRIPHRQLMAAIIKRTNGEVTCCDWYPREVAEPQRKMSGG